MKNKKVGRFDSQEDALSEIDMYERNNEGDLDFGNDAAVRLFAKYLTRHASGADTMRGYFAAFNRGFIAPAGDPTTDRSGG